jgi:hypothetical protein
MIGGWDAPIFAFTLAPPIALHLPKALLSIRNTARKLAWRVGIVLATAHTEGTVEIKWQTDMSTPTVWHWQERFLDDGTPELKLDTGETSAEIIDLETPVTGAHYAQPYRDISKDGHETTPLLALSSRNCSFTVLVVMRLPGFLWTESKSGIHWHKRN